MGQKIEVQDTCEWAELGARLRAAGPQKFNELLDALRSIVDAQETIAQFDWQLLFGERPSKRYLA